MRTEIEPTSRRSNESKRSHELERGHHRVSLTTVDATRALVADLERETEAEVRFDPGTRSIYATDASNYRQLPIGVVLPRSVEDVERIVSICHRHRVPILPRGGGTGLAGQTCNTAVVMDMTKHLDRVLHVDRERRIAVFEPGIVLDRLQQELEPYGLLFGPDPATHTHCTLGGMIGNNSCGSHSVQSGRTSDNIERLEVLTYRGLRLSVGPTSEEELDAIIREGGERGRIYSSLRQLRDKYADEIRQRFPNIPRRVSGFNLPDLLPENGFNVARALVGSEGTCVTVLNATGRLEVLPKFRVLAVLGFDDVFNAADQIPQVLEHRPAALEGMDGRLIRDNVEKRMNLQNLRLLPEGHGWLMAEFNGETLEEAHDKAHALLSRFEKKGAHGHVLDRPELMEKMWEVRESGLGATARVPGQRDTWEGWEDSAVDPSRLGAYLRDFNKLLDNYGFFGALYGHFGDGCLHTRITFDLESDKGVAQYRHFVEEAADLVVSHGGSLSGEHGDGQSRAELLPKLFGERLVRAFGEFKAIWDPDGAMNPGKVVSPYRLDENLRLGGDWKPWKPETHFRFPEDSGDFSRVATRCVGVGKCRKLESGAMCPSFMATRDEMHSTRGRARALFELLEDDLLKGGWRDKHVHEALSLCLACKACKGECPVNVDMATYKAEFLSHYYEGRLRPRAAYSMGLIRYWARLASLAPKLVNTLGKAPGLSQLAKAAAGISPHRSLPQFAEQTFRDWFIHRERERRPGGGKMRVDPRTWDDVEGVDLAAGEGGGDASDPEKRGGDKLVILWPDTFTNHFAPHIGQAAVRVLEAAGFTVAIPRRKLCCGRPLYDFGMLPLAKQHLREILDSIGPEIRDGALVVGLEPSCVATFRDELTNLYPEDETAKRLAKQTMLFTEFVDRYARDLPLSPLKDRALVQGHCHQKGVMGMDADQSTLERLGLDWELLDSGCCGMAGSFGFEKDKYDVSIKCGERVLFPRLRREKGARVVASGFSCREQIVQGTNRHAVHPAELMAEALGEGEGK